jgi:hypothetical protein
MMAVPLKGSMPHRDPEKVAIVNRATNSVLMVRLTAPLTIRNPSRPKTKPEAPIAMCPFSPNKKVIKPVNSTERPTATA